LEQPKEDKPDFSWFTTVEESKMEITDKGEISVSFWGFWKGNLDENDKQQNNNNSQLVSSNNIKIVSKNSDLYSNLIVIDYDNNITNSIPTLGIKMFNSKNK
jgi:hypothetical protein